MGRGYTPIVISDLPSEEIHAKKVKKKTQKAEIGTKEIHDILIKEIDDFPKHPFKVKDDEDMMNLVDSIKQNGILTPATVRLKKDGRYEMISGHRRKRACQLLGLDTLRCEVVTASKDEAIIFMCDSNLQRTTILPSEKAWSYKMRLDAMKRKAGRHPNSPDQPEDFLGNGVPLGPHLISGRARERLAKEIGESQSQILRYIRLTHLIPSLLLIVDEGRMGVRPAVELSYLTKDLQEYVRDEINYTATAPTHAQARRMRTLADKKELDKNVITDIMNEEKPNQKEHLSIRTERINNLFPKGLRKIDREDYIVEAMEHYAKVWQQEELECIR